MNHQINKIKDYVDYWNNHKYSLLPGSMQIDSKKPGEHIVIIGGLKGDEVGSVISLIKLHKFLSNNPSSLVNGKITFILGNPQAFKQNVSHIHHSLNKKFTNNPGNSYEGKRASTLMSFILESKPDLILDMRASVIGDMRMVSYRKEQSTSISIADRLAGINYYVAYEAKHAQDSLLNFAVDNQLVIHQIDCGNSKSRKSVIVSFNYLIRSLKKRKIINIEKLEVSDNTHTQTSEVQLFDIREMIKPQKNFSFIDDFAKTGTMIKKGTIYATFEGGHLVAHDDYYLFLPNHNPSIHDKHAGFLCKIYKFK